MCKIMLAGMFSLVALPGLVHAANIALCPQPNTIESFTASSSNPPPHNEGFRYKATDPSGGAWVGEQFQSASDNFLKHNPKAISISATGDSCSYRGDPQEDNQGNELYKREFTLTKDKK
ncbi:hypothetical protein CGA22_04660 [Pseudomonas sp. PSB18]|nr:hypothetical protein [Pseudomonas sp. PSB18]